jgi:hypothetical protein
MLVVPRSGTGAAGKKSARFSASQRDQCLVSANEKVHTPRLSYTEIGRRLMVLAPSMSDYSSAA